MPWSALPEHLNTPEKWSGSDWDIWYMRPLLKIKGWFAYGPRATEKWAKWRPIPKDLLNINATRKETLEDYQTKKSTTAHMLTYTSVIQYWTRWHFLIQWPFHISFHVFWFEKDVMPEPARKDFTLKNMVYVRFGARFDNDQIYWCPSLFIGGDFN